MGIKTLATVSDGTEFPNPRALKNNLRKLKRLQRAVSRKVKGSANRRKAVRKLASLHLRVSNIRQNALHQATSVLTKTKSAIGVENLNVSGLLKNEKLAQAIADVGLSEFRRQLEYKGAWYGCAIVMADRFFPSSQLCHVCGYQHRTLTLAEREWDCPNCQAHHQRDLNAALNLEQLAKLQTTASSAESYACGGEKSMPILRNRQVISYEAGTELLLGHA